ncbi:MAG: response regulator transcription factor [Myxococcales bacterium]|nr:response regulator transcription factor [Myxococcales bacterium]USN51535.1 MAG: response regulator transcription factor [Myxococcales bacterium]
MNIIRVFIIEDQPAILKAQVKLLSVYPDIEIVGCAMSGEEGIKRLSQLTQKPHVVLCDLGLPKMSGIEVTRHIKEMDSHIEVLIFTVFEDEKNVLAAIQAGASGYLLKGAKAQKIYEALSDVYQGGTVIQPSLARQLLKYFSMPLEGVPSLSQKQGPTRTTELGMVLSMRELECLQIIAKGLNNTEAAQVLGISTTTIRTHLEHIYQKLDVNNRLEAVTEGIRQGIIHL